MKDFWKLFDIFGRREWFVYDVDEAERFLNTQRRYRPTWKPEYELQIKARQVVVAYGAMMFLLWILMSIIIIGATPLADLRLALIGRWFLAGMIIILATTVSLLWVEDSIIWATEYDMQRCVTRQNLVYSYVFARNAIERYRGDALETELAEYIDRLSRTQVIGDFYAEILREKQPQLVVKDGESE